ncbi:MULTISPECIES: BsuPI-related putative proteinase inhibitor [Bacillaceae]|uniref:BsuPI-related putative proteinase inhibitor n=1 Tax=Bacillaceae TaxID=186817 RepID=UPI001E5D574D|nr:BsuPI-related putative proteinase inhibitor [Bacillus sp. Au-Bac7]MCE4050438.1 BsuPI-related putative proteinase inhibitor [Bacillus sp. Au-Bac7]
MLRVIIAAALAFSLFSFGGDRIHAEGNNLQFEISAKPNKDYAEIRMTVLNTGDKAVKLVFSSSQKYEFSIRAKGGKEVYRYSADKSFLQALQELKLKSNESHTWVEKWNYRKNNGELVPSGEYAVKAALLGKKNKGETITAKTTLVVPFVTDIKTTGQKGIYTIEGIAHTKERLTFTVEDGHKELLSKQPVAVTDVGSFKVNVKIKTEDLPKNGTLLLYFQEVNGKQSDPVILERFPS